MKDKIIHTPYKAYSRERDKWEWTVEVFKQEVEKYVFNTKEEAKEFKRNLLNESKQD